MDTTTLLIALAAVLAFGAGIALDRSLLARAGRRTLNEARTQSQRILDSARKKAEEIRQEQSKQAEQDLARSRREVELEFEESRRTLRRSRQKLEKHRERLNQRTLQVNEREALLHKASEALDALRKEAEQHRRDAEELRATTAQLLEETRQQKQEADRLRAEVDAAKAEVEAKRVELDRLVKEQIRKLEHVSGMSEREARELLLQQFLEEVKLESASRAKEIRDEAKLKANREARKIVLTAIQRTAASHAIENTVSVVNIHSDEMKGRIIGREGRNIRAFEAETGIEVIVDDTPEAVILSGFDPVRREIARLSLIKLVQDGRIHPARIEEIVAKVRDEVEEEVIETGERTVIDLNLHGLHPELVRFIGRMRYRTSYGQNLLGHSIETAHIASLIAAELGLDAARARRAGLLHDIGKVVEEDIESPHAIVGMELCRKYREDADVCNAVGAHHDEIEMTSFIAPIVQAADAISGARPGARREALEAYIRRLEKLEELAASFDGVERVYAIQAGREIRVLVDHALVSDAHAEQLASDISRKIQEDMQYPGQIKVTVIREMRSVAYAK